MNIPTLLVALVALNFSKKTEQTPAYELRSIEGWSVQVDRALLGERDELGQAALQLLQVKLFDITRVVHTKQLAKLRQVTIWLDRDDERFPCAVYHPSATWLEEHGVDVRKAKGVHIANAQKFLTWTLDQPSMVLHELAHAYHDQFLGYDHAGIRAAFEAAKTSKRYESVLRYDGTLHRHYALENDQEFFAEMTEAWLGVNDFAPFVRAEVMRDDVETAALLRKIWKR
jgi:hypothetical protein